MEIRPTGDQEAFIRQAIEAGRIAHPEDAVMQALALWEDRERRRIEVLHRLDAAESALAEEVKQRGRARLAAEATAA